MVNPNKHLSSTTSSFPTTSFRAKTPSEKAALQMEEASEHLSSTHTGSFFPSGRPCHEIFKEAQDPIVKSDKKNLRLRYLREFCKSDGASTVGVTFGKQKKFTRGGLYTPIDPDYLKERPVDDRLLRAERVPNFRAYYDSFSGTFPKDSRSMHKSNRLKELRDAKPGPGRYPPGNKSVIARKSPLDGEQYCEFTIKSRYDSPKDKQPMQAKDVDEFTGSSSLFELDHDIEYNPAMLSKRNSEFKATLDGYLDLEMDKKRHRTKAWSIPKAKRQGPVKQIGCGPDGGGTALMMSPRFDSSQEFTMTKSTDSGGFEYDFNAKEANRKARKQATWLDKSFSEPWMTTFPKFSMAKSTLFSLYF